MRTSLLLRTMQREARGARGRMAFFVLCLALGVAAVTGVAALVGALEAGVRARSRALLAADIALEGRRSAPPELEQYLAGRPDLRVTRVRELATMAAAPASIDAPGPSRLAELKVVDGTYPFHGELVLGGPGAGTPLEELLTPDSVAADPELLRGLGLEVGDELLVGGRPFRIVATVLEEPDRLDFAFTLGPRVLLSGEAFARTGLEGFGSRVRHRVLLALEGNPDRETLQAEKRRLEAVVPDDAYRRIQTHHEAQPQVRRGLERFEQFLGLVALLSLVLGGAGVAQIVRGWIAGKAPSVAILRCLGFRPRDVLVLYLANVGLLALVASLLGALAGATLPFLVPLLAGDVLPREDLVAFQPLAVLRGLVLGVGVAVLFALPPLTAVWRVSPAQVLRSEASPLPTPRWVRLGAWAALALGLLGSALAQAGTFGVAAAFTGGVLAVALVLAAASRAVVVLARRLPRGTLGPLLTHGIAALGRPGGGTAGAIVALGLGLLVVIGMGIVQGRLGGELEAAVPEDAPTTFLVDIQPDQWPLVRERLEECGATGIDSTQVVMARLSQVGGRPVAELVEERGEDGGRGRWVLTREQRLTWAEGFGEDNELVAGAPWSDAIANEVSLEVEFARDLGVGVGDRLTFDVQGVPLELVVTSLRAVQWESFRINFFVVTEPGVIEDAPGFRLAAARTTPEGEVRLRDRLALEAPNVTLLPVRELLEKVAAVLQRLAVAIRLLGGFTVLTGIAILAGAVSASTLRRAREAALWKTLGLSRGRVAALFAVEFALAGAVAGLVGGAGALALAGAFLARVVELDPELPWLALPLAVGAGALLATVAGLASSARALAVRPIESLRGAG